MENKKGIAVDIQSIIAVYSMFSSPKLNAADIMEIYRDTGILFFSSITEDGLRTTPPILLDGNEGIAIFDVQTDDGREKFKQYFDKLKQNQ